MRLFEVGTGSSALLLLSPPAAAAAAPQQALGGGMAGVTVAMLLAPMPIGRCLVDWPQPVSTSASHRQAWARAREDQCISTRRRTALRNCAGLSVEGEGRVRAGGEQGGEVKGQRGQMRQGRVGRQAGLCRRHEAARCNREGTRVRGA